MFAVIYSDLHQATRTANGRGLARTCSTLMFFSCSSLHRYWSLHDGDRVLPRIAWSYPEPLEGADSIADKIAFYATGLRCTVDGEVATPQAGGFYGGWITSDLAGPFKGEPGSSNW